MIRQGLVTAVKGEFVEVRMLRHSACSNCGGCAIGKAESKEEVSLALNKANATPGEFVTLSLPDSKIASAALTAYGIPLAAMLAGMLLGSALHLSDVGIFAIAGLGLLGSFAFNKLIMEPYRVKQQKYQVIAISVVDENNIEGVF